MDTKHIHCMLEDMAEYGKEMISCATGSGNVNLDDAGKIIDIVKDLACAEKDALIAKEMRKAHEEKEEEEKYMLRILKDEYKDEYKRYMDEYGEDGERRFYDNYRYKSSGRFAPKGRGSYMPRRGYDDPPYYHMTPDMMREHDPEYWRDVDRHMGKMYYTPMSDGHMGGSETSTQRTGDNVRGYSDGYADGMKDGRKSGESRYDRARRGYEETKEMHKGNTPQDNSENMKVLEELLNVVGGDVKELSPKMSPSEKAMAAQKLDTWSKMLKQ